MILSNRDVPFWKQLGRHGAAVALIDATSREQWSYRKLASDVEQIAQQLASPHKRLVFLPLNNRVDEIIIYLAALFSSHAVFPYGEQTRPADLVDAIEHYKPDIVVGPATHHAPSEEYVEHVGCLGGYHAVIRRLEKKSEINPLLTLLLRTSGSTGSSKLVRLSATGIDINAQQICQALAISPEHRAITSLPLCYVYGLSVLHSHLNAGASLVVDFPSVMKERFWEAISRYNVTSFAGVPWTYEIAQSIKLEQWLPRSIQMFTLSGDRIPHGIADWLAANFHKRGIDIYSMYGQTEACGRISVLPSKLFEQKKGSVGKPVVGGTITTDQKGNIIYQGPNVMLGYATTRDDLARGDDFNGVLRTGDYGHLDEQGFLFLTGRAGRLCKIFGLRVDLDEVQKILRSDFVLAVLSKSYSNRITIVHQDGAAAALQDPVRALAAKLGIPRTAIELVPGSQAARMDNGKIGLDSGHSLAGKDR